MKWNYLTIEVFLCFFFAKWSLVRTLLLVAFFAAQSD